MTKGNRLHMVDDREVHKTPRGIAIWPHLVQPNTKFDPGGTYDIRLKIPNKTLEAEFLMEMEETRDMAYKWACQKETKRELPREEAPWKRNEQGEWEFKFKARASGVFEGRAWTGRPPQIFDAKGVLVADTSQLKIGNGTELKVLFQVRPYFVQKAGISLRLKGVQIFTLVGYDDAAALGVVPEEGDFVAPTPTYLDQESALVDAMERSLDRMSFDKG